MKNKGLVKLRVDHDLTQKQAAKLLGVNPTTYNHVETGKRPGTKEFWLNVQKQFELGDGEVWRLQNNLCE